MILEIPVKNHVKVFCLRHFGDEANEVIDVRKNSSLLGSLLYGLLNQCPVAYEESVSEKQTAVLKIDVKFQVDKECINTWKLRLIGEVLEDLFAQSMSDWVRGRMDKMPSLEGGVKRFFELNGISEEDYQIDAARKMVERNDGERRARLRRVQELKNKKAVQI